MGQTCPCHQNMAAEAAVLCSVHVYLLRQSGTALRGGVHSLPDVQPSCGETDYKRGSLVDLQYQLEAVPPALWGEDLGLAQRPLAASFSYLYPDAK